MTTRRWLVTGCSSGLGQALVQRLASAGECVLATARDVSTLAHLPVHESHVATATLDVRDVTQCADAVALAVERFGGIDVLVNNAAYGQVGVVEEVSDDELAAQFATNVFGPWRLLREVLPLWREQGGGHGIFASSLAGSMAFPGLAAYTASKFALEGLAEALAAEAGPLGVKVTILQLGGFATSYGRKLQEPARRIAAYEPVVSETLSAIRGVAENETLSQPALYAQVVQRLAAMDNPPLRLPFGNSAFEYLEAILTARRTEFDALKAAQT
jgi:NAD(P)-dependent dehydrogenase (short-subunit alcohol dehydrogenase family)